MPSTSEPTRGALFYGFRNVTHARKLLRFCASIGYQPDVVFTVTRTGSIVAMLGPGMPTVYVRIRSLKLGLLDWTVIPQLLARGLKSRAEKALRNHVSAAESNPIRVDLPSPTPAQ